MVRKVILFVFVLSLVAIAWPVAAQVEMPADCQHLVGGGDTLTSLAATYGGSIREWQNANSMTPADTTIRAGSTLVIPNCTLGEPAPVVEEAVIGVPMSEIETLLAPALADGDVFEGIVALNDMWDNHWSAADVAFDWGKDDAAAGLTIEGEAVFYTDLGDDIPARLPQGVEKMLAVGDWGIYHVAAGFSYEIPSVNPGGRWVVIGDGLPTVTATCDEFEALMVELADMDSSEIIRELDSRTEDRIHFAANETIDVYPGEVAVIYTNWHGAPPDGVVALREDLVSGGAGVWKTAATFVNTEDGGGVYVVCGAGE